jgi:hypothetical protein
MPLETADINSRLETLKLDSARFERTLLRMDRNCFEYKAYYHRSDSLPLLVEQFFHSGQKHRAWKKSVWKPGTVEGVWHFSMDGRTGLPCFETITETGRITLLKEDTKAEQPITLYRYEEDLYLP